MTTAIFIYPNIPRPKWLRIGTTVEVLGEGSGVRFRVVAIEKNRAAVVPAAEYRRGHPGGCWESFGKIYRPGKMDQDLNA